MTKADIIGQDRRVVRKAMVAVALAVAAPLSAQTVVATTGAPAPVQVTTAIDPARLALGVELATVLNSEPMVRAQLRIALGKTLPEMFGKDENFIALEKEHPGITGEMIAAMGKVITEATIVGLPAKRVELGRVYAQSLTVAELTEIIAFYRSPTGTRVIALMGEGLELSNALQDFVDADGKGMTVDSLRTDLRRGATRTMQQLTPAERMALVRFGMTPAGRKLPAVNARVQQWVADDANKPDPVLEAKIDAALQAVLRKYGLGAPTT